MDQTHPCPQGTPRTHTKNKGNRVSGMCLMLGVCSGPGEHEGEVSFPWGAGRQEKLDIRSDILVVSNKCLGCEQR